MRKGLIVLLVVVLAAMFALPAVAADIKAAGFYRSKAWMSNFHDGAGGPSLRTGEGTDTEQTNAYVEQRARAMFQFGTENVKAVWFLESDMLWGDSSAVVGRNQGGALGADSIQIETKNLYLWFKLPDTSLDFTVGLQNQSDDYAGVLWGGADFAGVFINGKYEPVKWKLGWAKLYENATQKTDDATLYQANVYFVPTKDLTVGANFYFLQDDTGKPGTAGAAKLNPGDAATPPSGYSAKLYTPGVNVTWKAGPATITGFAAYQWGKFESVLDNASDIDVKAYMLDARGEMKIGPANAFLEGLYISGDDKEDEYNSVIGFGDYQGAGTGPGGNSSYTRTRMQIMLASWDTINVSQCIVGCSGGEYGDSLGLQGRGLWHVAAGANMNLTPKIKAEANIGYAAAVKLRNGDTHTDKSIGTEINAGVNYSIMQGLDFGLFGAYMWLGDFVQDPAPSSSFKDPWTTYARINYAF